MNKYIIIICLFLFFYNTNIETYNNYKNEPNAVKKLKYINKVYFNNRGKIYTEKSIKFTKNKINDNRVIYSLAFDDTTELNKHEVISKSNFKKIINLILPEYNNYFKPKMKRIEEIIIGYDNTNKINKLYIRIDKILKSLECNDIKCKKKIYYEDIKIPVRKLKKKLNTFYKNKYSIFDKLGITNTATIHIKTEKGKMNYYHILLYPLNIILGKYKNYFKKFINDRYPKLRLNNIFEKYKNSHISYFSLGNDGITLYLDQKYI